MSIRVKRGRDITHFVMINILKIPN